MRHNRTKNPGASKEIARAHYRTRQMDKFIKWSLETKGCLKWKDLVEQHDYLKIEVL